MAKYLLWFLVVLSLAGTAFAQELTGDQLLDLDDAPQKVVYKQIGDQELRLHVYQPPGTKPDTARPALLVIHGGGWASPGPFYLAHVCRYFAHRGMVTINVEYRLVSKDTEIRIDDCLADCRDALAYVRQHAADLGVNAKRIVVAGESAGGHLAAMLGVGAGQGDPLPQAAALYNPAVDLVAIPWLKGHSGVAPRKDTPADQSWEDRARVLSPNQYVKPGLPPMLLIHGSADSCIDVSQAEAFAKQMRAAKNKITFQRMPGWNHAFLIPDYGTEAQIVKALQLTDEFLAKLGDVEGKPILKERWQPSEYHRLFTEPEKAKPYVQARSFSFEDYPFLDGQWQGILTDSDDNTWFGISSHSGIHHAQVFRYSPKLDRVDHIADLGEVCGEQLPELADGVPEGKVHGNLFQDGDLIYGATTDAHRLHDEVYSGGYWLAIHRSTGKIENLGRTITKDGLLCFGYDSVHKLMYGHTNVKGLLTCFDPKTKREEVLGFPWEGSKQPWPRGPALMITKDGRVYGARPPKCSFWEYDPQTKKFRTFTCDMPEPDEIKAGADAKKTEQWETSAAHLAIWNEKDQCFYLVRSFDEMLMRFYPPATAGGPARIEALRRLRPDGLEMRYNLRAASCTLVMHDRTIYYTPNTAWGGVTRVVSYQVDKQEFKDYGPLITDGRRRVTEVHSMSVGGDGKLYMVAFVFSVKGVDPVRPYSMRDKYPFHPRFLIVDPAKDFRPGLGE